MAKNWAETVLLCGAVALLGACGSDGDDDDDTDKPAEVDAGNDADTTRPDTGVTDAGGAVDSGGVTPDAGAQTDAGSAEVAAALDRAGIKVSAERAGIIFPLACKNAVTCQKESDAAKCAADTRASYDQRVSQGNTDACLDATLDFYSCFATAACANFDAECGPLYQTQLSICPKVDAGP